MVRAMGGVRVGLVGLAAAVMMVGYVGAQPEAVAAQACRERHEAAPIDEDGTECPGNPTVWKSRGFLESGVGYFTETEDLGRGQTRVRVSYQHRDGPLAVATYICGSDGCTRDSSNGVPLPFEAPQTRQDGPRRNLPGPNGPGQNGPRPNQPRPSDMI